MKIKTVMLAASSSDPDDRVTLIFKQLGCKEKEHNGQQVLSIITTPDIMAQKVEIALDQLRRLGYDRSSRSMNHFWYISDNQRKRDTITIESQGEEGFVQTRHEFLVYW
jgi:hypothetical protein